MYDFDSSIQELSAKAKAHHHSERRMTLQSIRLIAELEGRKAWFHMGMSVEKFAVHIGLSPSQYWKRAKVALLLRRFPKFAEMFERGETELSQLVIVAGKITEANAQLILDGIRGKARREVETFLSRVTCDGRLLDSEGILEFTARLKESEYALLERAREVLAHGGHVPSNGEILAEALDALLEKKDPLRKAERAQKRREKEAPTPKLEDFRWTAPVQESPPDIRNVADESAVEGGPLETPDLVRPSPAPGTKSRPTIPAHVKHQVWIRDQGRCTYENPDGSRCEQRMMLEIDHQQMVCRGGSNALENLSLRCRYHNRFTAAMNLGQDFMEQFRRSS